MTNGPADAIQFNFTSGMFSSFARVGSVTEMALVLVLCKVGLNAPTHGQEEEWNTHVDDLRHCARYCN